MTDIDSDKNMACLDAENQELRRENRNLATQVDKRKQVEGILFNRIVQLEEKQSEDDVTLCGINRFWRIFDENCRLFCKQFNVNSDVRLFDKLDNNADSFLVQLSTWDMEELKEKLEKRVECSKQTMENMASSLRALLIRTNRLQTLLKAGVNLKPADVNTLQQFIKIRQKIITLQKNYYVLNLRLRNKHDILNIKETRNDELRNRVDNLRYQNTKMKALTDRMEHNLAELLDSIKLSEKSSCEPEPEMEKNEKENGLASTETSSPTNDRSQELEEEIKEQKKISEKYLSELQMLKLKEQESMKQLEMLKIDMRQLPEKIILQTKKYKYLQSKFSILYNEATQLRQSWDEVQKQMQQLEFSFNSTQESSERDCLIQQKNLRQELIKLDDTNGQLRRESQKLRMELEQSVAENNLFGSLNSEMKKLMSSMLDYCKQHESDIKRYKRKHEEIEEDIRFSKTLSPVKMKCNRLIQLVRYREYQKRMKERDILNDKFKDLPPPKFREPYANDEESFADSKDLINAKELQHIKNIINSKDSKPNSSKVLALRDPREVMYKEFLHPKDTSIHKDQMNPRELSYCKDLSMPDKKIIYSKEVLRSKELLKERYLRDCTRMKMKEFSKDTSRHGLPSKTEIESDVEMKEVKLEVKPNKDILRNFVKEVSNESKISSIVNLDSDDSGHDEPKFRQLEENKQLFMLKDVSPEENFETASGVENQNPDKVSDNKDQPYEIKKIAPPTKRDIEARKLKYQLKQIMDEKKDLNLLLSMYKNMNKADEEKVQLMVSEQKLKTELEEVKKQMRRIEESRYDDRKDLVDVAMARKIKYLLAKRRRLQKKIEEAKDSLLCGEMEITGQVWDELQAQNTRLHQLLREKDEENLKLMTERVKSNQLYNIAKEDNEILMQHIKHHNAQIEATSEIIQKMEERELAYRNRLSFLEQELVVRKKTAESNRRKAVENAQSASNLKRQIEKYQTLSKELLEMKNERCASVESKIQKNNLLLEEVIQLRKKVERMKKYESVEAIEAILSEELREYKNILTCPSCKVNTKDAVLIKCFHVYCMNCIKTRYETRQRKCPECCALFGANDYHRLFLFN